MVRGYGSTFLALEEEFFPFKKVTSFLSDKIRIEYALLEQPTVVIANFFEVSKETFDESKN